jgi:hypothetical protein
MRAVKRNGGCHHTILSKSLYVAYQSCPYFPALTTTYLFKAPLSCSVPYRPGVYFELSSLFVFWLSTVRVRTHLSLLFAHVRMRLHTGISESPYAVLVVVQTRRSPSCLAGRRQSAEKLLMDRSGADAGGIHKQFVGACYTQYASCTLTYSST